MNSIDKLWKIRHTCEHVLNQAMRELYGKNKILRALGPATDTGFYFDFQSSSEFHLTQDMFTEIEQQMRQIIKKDLPLRKEIVSADKAKLLFSDEPYKLLRIDEYINKGYELSVYRTGNEYIDLCAGPHAPSTGAIGGFSLLSIAGAYRKGSEKNAMLTRIYGTAFATKEEMRSHKKLLQEAKKRDHKILGKKLNLFTFSEYVGSGLPLFTPKGEIIKHELESWMRKEKQNRGYQFVETPHIAKRQLYEKSGHMGKYDAMMPVMKDQYGEEFIVKPMNCPHHFEIFTSQPHSYKDFPIRYAENGTCYRNEKSGEVSGLTRVKSLTQDDTHHFVRHDQIESEITMIRNLMQYVYGVLNFTNFKVEISIRDPHNKKGYQGTEEMRTTSEKTLINLVKQWGVPYAIEEGEAAFYGPKIDVRVDDAIGRSRQLTTIQLDFAHPENFDMEYTASDGSKQRPAVIHVAVLGSSHRFMGVMIEHFSGIFPLRLAPIQVQVIPIAEKHSKYCHELHTKLQQAGIRSSMNTQDDSLSKKVRNAEKQRINYILIAGDEEIKHKSVSVRNYKNKEKNVQQVETLIPLLLEEIHSKQL